MKTYTMILRATCVVALAGAFASCSKDDEPEWIDNGTKVELPADRMYILNQGTQGLNNANISLYSPKEDKLTADIFQVQNGMNLGDTGQDMIAYDGHIYVAIYDSNYLAKLNAAAVEEDRVSFTNDPDLQGKIRYIAAEDGYIYASFYGGVVAKINAHTLEVEQKLNGLGSNIEGVAIEDNTLYVANSYSHTGSQYVYHENVYTIDLKTFTKKREITVAPNPNQMLEEDDKIFLISWGNYADRGYEFQIIDTNKSYQSTTLATATKMCAGNDRVYLVNSDTDYSNWPEIITENTFFYYDTKTGKVVNESFIKDPENRLKNVSVSMMAADDKTGDIYIGATNYSTSNGTIFRIGSDGTILSEFGCGGQNPWAAVFLNK